MNERSQRLDPVHPPSLLDQVSEGMVVVDAAGERVGTVEYVRMGDPQAVTVQGNEPDAPGLIGAIGMAVGGDEREPDVAGPQRSQLRRSGFVKVDGPGLFGADRYVRGDRIARVAGDTVTLAVRRDQLPTER